MPPRSKRRLHSQLPVPLVVFVVIPWESALAFAVLVVILGEDLLLFVVFAFFFFVFGPKNACQAPPSPNQLQINNIRVAF
jgi:hypothetical protein